MGHGEATPQRVKGLHAQCSVLGPTVALFSILTAIVAAQHLAVMFADDLDADLPMPLAATIVATGIPGAGAIAQVGTFHHGGPFAPGGALASASHPVLDRTRLLTSNFGAPLARPAVRAGRAGARRPIAGIPSTWDAPLMFPILPVFS
jgi:hypothetical protein